ncbi:DUF6415 family natural product biosynthesis protein [Streptomyces sp. NPDC055796]
MNPGETQAIGELAARALAPYERRPDAEGVARLVDDLITAGQELHTTVSGIPAADRTERAGAALVEWAYFAEAGPLRSDDRANWNHARGLARIIQAMASTLGKRESGACG